MKRKLTIISLILAAVFLLAACGQQTGGDVSTAEMTVTKPDGTKTAVTMDTLLGMETAEFTTEQGTSKSGPEKNTHKGVLLKDLLENIGVDTDQITEVQVTSTDGFASVYSKQQLSDPDKLYLTYEMDGAALTGENGESDVFYIIAKNEEFKQNWTKYVESMVIR